MKLLKLIALSLSFLWVSANAQNLPIATGGTGGVYYPMGGGLAAVLSSKVPGMAATAEVTGGSVDNLNLVGSGKPYVGFSMADAAKDAQSGEGKSAGKRWIYAPSSCSIQISCTLPLSNLPALSQ